MIKKHEMARRQCWQLVATVVTVGLGTCGLTVPAVAAEQDPWYLDRLRAEEMWQHAEGEGITVAVIDSGVEASLPELSGRVMEGLDISYEPEEATIDEDGHGTDMAALIAASGAGGGLQGLAPEASILPIRISNDGFGFDLDRQVVEGIQYAVESGAQIISISQGDEFAVVDEEVREAIAEAARNDVLIFASTGNGALKGNPSEFPANQEGVVGVGASDRSGERAGYSTYGPQVALAAPANDIRHYCDWQERTICVENGGTSSATALASASAALIWSEHPDWTKNQVLRVMMETAAGPAGAQRKDEIGYGVIRPDRVIIDGDGNPGDPDINPLFPEYEAGLPPAESDPGETLDSSDTRPESDPGDEQELNTSPDEMAMEEADGGSSIGPWLLFALAGVVLAGGLITALILSCKKAHQMSNR